MKTIQTLSVVGAAGAWLLFGSATTSALLAQSPGRDVDAEQLVESLAQGKFVPATLDRVARKHLVQAIPLLEKQFAIGDDPFTKQIIASALVRLGHQSPEYWEFIARKAVDAIRDQTPYPLSTDADGNFIAGQFSPEFVAWVQAHDLSLADTAAEQLISRPTDVLLVAVTRNRAAEAILLNALQSRNYAIQAMGAKGLAVLGARSAIASIVAACANAPSGAASHIAQALVFFNDPQADAVAGRYIKNDTILAELRRLNRLLGRDALF